MSAKKAVSKGRPRMQMPSATVRNEVVKDYLNMVGVRELAQKWKLTQKVVLHVLGLTTLSRIKLENSRGKKQGRKPAVVMDAPAARTFKLSHDEHKQLPPLSVVEVKLLEGGTYLATVLTATSDAMTGLWQYRGANFIGEYVYFSSANINEVVRDAAAVRTAMFDDLIMASISDNVKWDTGDQAHWLRVNKMLGDGTSCLRTKNIGGVHEQYEVINTLTGNHETTINRTVFNALDRDPRNIRRLVFMPGTTPNWVIARRNDTLTSRFEIVIAYVDRPHDHIQYEA